MWIKGNELQTQPGVGSSLTQSAIPITGGRLTVQSCAVRWLTGLFVCWSAEAENHSRNSGRPGKADLAHSRSTLQMTDLIGTF